MEHYTNKWYQWQNSPPEGEELLPNYLFNIFSFFSLFWYLRYPHISKSPYQYPWEVTQWGFKTGEVKHKNQRWELETDFMYIHITIGTHLLVLFILGIVKFFTVVTFHIWYFSHWPGWCSNIVVPFSRSGPTTILPREICTSSRQLFEILVTIVLRVLCWRILLFKWCSTSFSSSRRRKWFDFSCGLYTMYTLTSLPTPRFPIKIIVLI